MLPLRSIPRAGRAGLLVLLLALPAPSLAEDLRVMTYNLLNYPGANGGPREVHFRSVLNQVQPDLLVTQEVQGLVAANQFLDNVLDVVNPGEWSLATFTGSPDTDRACFYRTAQLDLQGSVVLPTALRDINGWFFRPDGTSGESDFRIYTLHLKASQGTDNENQRLGEVTVLRNHLNALPGDTHFMVLGDYNIYTSSEPAWGKLTGSEADNDGRVFDPVNRVGSWHDNASFSDVHSQSPRTVDLGDGGATGGMDDRFDMALLNDDMLDDVGLDYIVDSYTVFGQDGNHFNQAINSGVNTAVPDSIADALYAASDHLPVFLDIETFSSTNPPVMVVTGDVAFGPVLVGGSVQRPVVVANAATPPSDDLDYTASIGAGFTVTPAPGPLEAGESDTLLVTIDTNTVGQRLASLIVDGDDPTNASDTLLATGNVLNHAQPSMDDIQVVTEGVLFFGSRPQGTFSDSTLVVYNFLHGPSQALLDTWSYAITGVDSARFTLVGWSPQIIGGTPGSVTVSFDDTNVTAMTPYEASLSLFNRDDPSLPGATALADLTWDLFALVTEVATDAAPVVRSTRLYDNVPNPFNPGTTIAFDLRAASPVQLVVFDARGRRVRTLVQEQRPAGPHRVVWDGRDANGRALPSGIYFARMHTPDFERTVRMTLLR